MPSNLIVVDQQVSEEAQRVADRFTRKWRKWHGISSQEQCLLSYVGSNGESITATDRRLIITETDVEESILEGTRPAYRSIPYRSITYWTFTPKRETEHALLYLSTNITVDGSPVYFNLYVKTDEVARNIAETIAASMPPVVTAPPEGLDD